jgi:hypothetical protein
MVHFPCGHDDQAGSEMRRIRWPPLQGTMILAWAGMADIVYTVAFKGDWAGTWLGLGLLAFLYLLALLWAQVRK